MASFDYSHLIDTIEHSLDEYDEPQLDRAWEIVKGCIEVHARVDRREDETPEQALALAWHDYWLCFKDEEEDAPYTFWGLAWEMLHSVGEERKASLRSLIVEAGGGKPARKRKPARKKANKPSTPTTPHLRLVK
jgi:hypothetical protein